MTARARPDQLGLDRFVVLCRPGFEGDTAAELASRLESAGSYGHARTRDDAGLLEFMPGDGNAWFWLCQDTLAAPVFPRQCIAAGAPVDDLPATDRLRPLLGDWSVPVGDALVECPEGDSHRDLSKLAQRLTGPLRGLLQERGLWRPDEPSAPRLHVVLDSGSRAWLGLAPRARSSPLPGGIPRMRRRGGAPSRSALKLEEALSRMLGETQRYMLLQDGSTAVDLGAAPGGWTWVLREWGLPVTAVDNGALAPALVADPEVEHVRADAFTWQPLRPVDWLVCDLVDKPARVVELMARWLRRGWAKQALFNLKLPMQRRWQAVEGARERFFKVLGPEADAFELTARHLYHDREEVTLLALRIPGR